MTQRCDGPGHVYTAELHDVRQEADKDLKAYATRIQVAARKANRFAMNALPTAQNRAVHKWITRSNNRAVINA